MTSVAGRRVRTATSDTIESFLLKVLLYGVGFGASIIISRGLGPSGRGIYYLPVVTAATVAAFGTLGIEQANVFLFGSRGVPIAQLWAQGGMVALILGLLGGILLVAAPSLLPEAFGTTPTVLWWIAAIGLPFALHTQFSAGLLTLRGDVTWQFRAGVVSAVLQVVSLLGLYAADLFTPLTVLVVTVCTSASTWILIVSRLQSEGRWVRMGYGAAQADAGPIARPPRRYGPALSAPAPGTCSCSTAWWAPLRSASIRCRLRSRRPSSSAPTPWRSPSSLVRWATRLQDAALTALRAARISAVISAGFITAMGNRGLSALSYIAFGRPFANAYLPLLALLPGIAFMGMQRVCGGPVPPFLIIPARWSGSTC